MKRVTAPALSAMKERGERISMLTCYDATFARLVDQAGIDAVLVGDSLGMVVQGHESTLPVTVDDIVYHCRAVSRALKRAHLVADMPFMSYQASAEDALRNAGRMLAEAGAQSVKLEGGAEIAPTVRRLVHAGIPVMGHIGLTPQSVHALGGFTVQGRDEESARRLMADALALQEAGAFSVVLEAVPRALATAITARLQIPSIGIGAGEGCDGQVLVLYDALGLNAEFHPRFVKRYLEGHALVTEALARYSHEVKSGEFPAREHAFESQRSAPALRLVSPAGESDEAEGSSLYAAPV